MCYEIPTEFGEIKGQRIWANSHIRKANMPFLDKKWKSKIEFLYQLVHVNDKRFLSTTELQQMYDTNLSVMELNSLISAIPGHWKSILKYEKDELSLETQFEKLERDKYPTKKLYSQYVKRSNTKGTHRILWEKDLDIEIQEEKWETVFTNIFKVTNAVKLRDFHYKIVYRTLITNTKRAKYAQVSEMCNFCQSFPETLEHLFCKCPKVRKLWSALNKWVSKLLKEKIYIADADIILNNVKGKYAQLLNTMVLIMKRYIYVTKCKDNELNFTAYMALVDHVHKVEKITAIRQCKFKNHVKKWKPHTDFYYN